MYPRLQLTRPLLSTIRASLAYNSALIVEYSLAMLDMHPSEEFCQVRDAVCHARWSCIGTIFVPTHLMHVGQTGP